MSGYSASSFSICVDHNDDVSKEVTSCTLTTLSQYNRLVSSLLIEINATEEVFKWVNDLDYFQPHYISYSVQGFGIGDNFAIKKVEMKSDKEESGTLKIIVLAESMLRSVTVIR